jgi:hypothetical protein
MWRNSIDCRLRRRFIWALGFCRSHKWECTVALKALGCCNISSLEIKFCISLSSITFNLECSLLLGTTPQRFQSPIMPSSVSSSCSRLVLLLRVYYLVTTDRSDKFIKRITARKLALLRSHSLDVSFISATLCARKLSEASYTHACYSACYLQMTFLTFDWQFYLLIPKHFFL